MRDNKERKKQRSQWEIKFLNKIKLVHKRNLTKVVEKLLKKIDRRFRSLATRSKKYNVEYNISIDDLRQLVFESYGKKCKYCDKIITTNNFVFDHIKPISHGGSSTKSNLQVICKTSNTMKGSLEEADFVLLLEWLKNLPEHVRRDVTIRLSRGIH